MALEMKYFVLKPKGNDPHANASRVAMRAYADHIVDVDPELAVQLYEWTDIEHCNAVDAALGGPDNG